MKNLITLLLMAITYTGFAQISPPAVPKAGTKQATTNQAYIYRSLTGDTTRYYLRIGASGIPADYFEISNGAGGGITSVTSANGDISVANPTTTPVLTLNSGYAAGQVAKFSIAPGSGIRLAWDVNFHNSIYTNPTTRVFYYDAGTASFGGHTFRVNGGNDALRLATNSYVTMPRLSTGLTAPSTVGTEKMVTTDANGTLSWQNIPTGSSGTVTNVSSGYGTNFSPITSTGPVIIDSTVIASKRYVDTLVKYTTNRGIKDFFTDSTVSANTGLPKILYMDTLKANTFVKNGDVVRMKVSGRMDVLIVADQYLYVNYNGTNLIPFTITPTAIGNLAWEMNITVMKASSTTTYISATLATSSSSSPMSSKLGTVVGTSFTSPRQLGVTASQSGAAIGSLTARMGYIEFKPASL